MVRYRRNYPLVQGNFADETIKICNTMKSKFLNTLSRILEFLVQLVALLKGRRQE